MVGVRARLDYLLAGALAVLTLAVTAYFAPRGFNAGFVDLAHDGLQLRQVLDLAHGGVIFRDTFDQYGVLAPYLNLAGFLAFGERLLSIKYFIAAWYGATAVMLYVLSRQYVGRTLSVFSVLLWLGLAPFYQHGIMLSPHAYALLFQAAALVLVLRDPAGERQGRLWLVGVLCGICWLLKQSLGTLFLAAIVLYFMTTPAWETGTLRAATLRAARVLGGFALVVAAATIWLATQGALRDWYLQSVVFPNAFYLSYYRDTGGENAPFLVAQSSVFVKLQATAESVWLDLRTLVLAGGVSALFAGVRSARVGRLAVLLVMALVAVPFWGVAHVRELVVVAMVLATVWRAPADPKMVLALWVTACLWLAAFPSGNHMHQWWTISISLGAGVYMAGQWANYAVRALKSPALVAAPLAVGIILLLSGPAMAARWSDGWSRRYHPSCCAVGDTPRPEPVAEPAILKGIQTDPSIRQGLALMADAMNRFRAHHPGVPVVSIDSHDGIDTIPASLLLLSIFPENESPGPLRWNLPVLASSVYPGYHDAFDRFVRERSPLIVDYQRGNTPSPAVPGYYLLAASPTLDGAWLLYAPHHADSVAHGEPIAERPQWPLDSTRQWPVLPLVEAQSPTSVAVPEFANALADQDDRVAVKSWPADLRLPSLTTSRAMFARAEIAHASPLVQRTERSLAFPGPADGPFSYLLQFKEQPLDEGETFLARGELTEGGITVGLLENGAWAGFANVDQPGRFVVAIQAPHRGRYSLVIANNVTAPRLRERWQRHGFFAGLGGWLTGSLPNSFLIDDAGWIDPQPR